VSRASDSHSIWASRTPVWTLAFGITGNPYGDAKSNHARRLRSFYPRRSGLAGRANGAREVDNEIPTRARADEQPFRALYPFRGRGSSFRCGLSVKVCPSLSRHACGRGSFHILNAQFYRDRQWLRRPNLSGHKTRRPLSLWNMEGLRLNSMKDRVKLRALSTAVSAADS
jgi:hypothetical protein